MNKIDFVPLFIFAVALAAIGVGLGQLIYRRYFRREPEQETFPFVRVSQEDILIIESSKWLNAEQMEKLREMFLRTGVRAIVLTPPFKLVGVKYLDERATFEAGGKRQYSEYHFYRDDGNDSKPH